MSAPVNQSKKKKAKQRIVVFLGAGASRDISLPLTNEILPEIVSRLLLPSEDPKALFGGDADARHQLKECFEAIFPGFKICAERSRMKEDWKERLPSITDLLSSIDYHLLSSNAPGPNISCRRLDEVRRLLERAVFELLVRQDPIRRLSGDTQRQCQRIVNEVLYKREDEHEKKRKKQVDWLKKLASSHRVTIISTNYDIEIEQGLFEDEELFAEPDDVFGRVDFGIGMRNPNDGRVYQRPDPDNAKFGLHKLHGSLNWLRCDVCDNVYLHPSGPQAYFASLFGTDSAGVKQKATELDKIGLGVIQCHCGSRPLRHMLVAPSFVRSVRDPIFLEIWHNALEALRQADEWIIIGYSLPTEDVAIRSIFLRSFKGRDSKQPPEIKVVQKDNQGPALLRYQLLFPNLEPSKNYFGGEFSACLDILNQSRP